MEIVEDLVEMEVVADLEEIEMTEGMIDEEEAVEAEEAEIVTIVIGQDTWQEIVPKATVEKAAEEAVVDLAAEVEVEVAAELATIAIKRDTWHEIAQKVTEEIEEEDSLELHTRTLNSATRPA